MVEQDYIMRLIKEMIRAIFKLLFQIDTESPSLEILENQQAQQMLKDLYELVELGNIDRAENMISDIIEDGEMQDLKMALLFYSYLNDKSDEFLVQRGFSRNEVKFGVQNLVSYYGLGSIAEAFLEE